LRYAVRLREEIDVPALQQAFQQLIDRHPSLRTIFRSHRGEPMQQVREKVVVHFKQIDATPWSETEFQARLEAEAHLGFDLESGPLFRVTLFTRAANDHVLLQTIHHIVADLWSQAIIAQEIGRLYRNAELEPVPLRFSDFVRWQGEMLASPQGDRLWDYWKEKLAGEIPVLNLPTDRPRPVVQTFHGNVKTIKLSGKLTENLHELSEQHGATLFMTLLAAFKILLHRYTGQDDIVVGTPTTGRSHNDLAPIVGYFVNPLPLRSDLTGAPRFSELLQQVRKTVVEAINHQDYPLALLVEKLQPKRDTSRTPLFQVMFILQRAHLLNEAGLSSFAIGNEANELHLEGLSMQAVPLEEHGAPFELTLMLAETDNGLAASLTYNSELFDAATIERILAQFNQLLVSIVDQPTASIASLSMLPEVEAQQILQRFNDTHWPFPENECAHELIERRAQELPSHPAVIFEGQTLTCQELNQRANQFAHRLRERGVGPDVMVGICVERSLEMIVCLLAVLKAGGAYLPMDPDYPAERLAFMVADSQAPIIITQEKFAEKFNGQSARLFQIDREAEQIAQQPIQNPASGVAPENLAYVIYTSGSTGRPKGTLLPHRGLVNFASAHFPALGMNHLDKMLQFASFSFDASVSEIFTALFAGATLVLARRETILSSPQLIELLQTEKVTAAILPPSMLSVLPAAGLPDLRIIISAGENCTAEIVEKWAPGRRFFNGYGPTEATVGPTLHQVRKITGKIPIGQPLSNIRTYLLDAYLNPVPLGVPGELHLGGVCVARGYHQRPEMTAEKFIPDPFSPEPGARLYKTGDLARYLPDGVLEFLGRIDHQVKVRGFRIEVSEIETVLANHNQIKDVLVLARADKSGLNRLVAYWVPQNGAPVEPGELRQYLQERLPEYMVPSLFIALEKFPLSPNGKVDRKALPEPADGFARQATFVKPGNELEQKLAEIWQEVLGLEKVGVHDNFFEIGGHSLAMVKVHAALCEYLQKEISVVEMFKYPTIQSLGRFLNETGEKTPLFVEQQARAARQKQALEMQRQRMLNRRK
jgi:amino acid adenylation domain-containing protein